jgi:hypothetical protein
MRTKLILSAFFLMGCAFVCLSFIMAKKPKQSGKIKTLQNEIDNGDAFMMDTFEPIEDFEMVYFDENRGLVQIKTKR